MKRRRIKVIKQKYLLILLVCLNILSFLEKSIKLEIFFLNSGAFLTFTICFPCLIEIFVTNGVFGDNKKRATVCVARFYVGYDRRLFAILRPYD